MRRQVNHDAHEHNGQRDVQRCGTPGVITKGFAKRKVDILVGRGESRRNECEQDNDRLQSPAAAVVPEPVKRPQEQDWQNHMEERKQPDPQRISHVEEVIRPADKLAPEEIFVPRIDAPRDVDQQRRDGLARK